MIDLRHLEGILVNIAKIFQAALLPAMVIRLMVIHLWDRKGHPECDTVAQVQWGLSHEVVQWEDMFHVVLILV